MNVITKGDGVRTTLNTGPDPQKMLKYMEAFFTITITMIIENF